MNSFKIKFSDVLRYFILGCIELFLFYAFECRCSWASDWATLAKQVPATLLITSLAIGLYVLGFLTQSIIQLIMAGDFLGTGIGEEAEFIHRYPTSWLNSGFYPNWLYWSDRPSRVLEIYRNVLETEDTSDGKTEFLYSNQLFQGIAFSTMVICLIRAASCYPFLIIAAGLLVSAVVVHLVLRFHWTDFYWAPIILGCVIIVAIALCFGLFLDEWMNGCLLASLFGVSVFFASRLARKQIRRIDILANFNKDNSLRFNEILARVGVPKVYVLTRTNSLIYIREELQSVQEQTYPNVKVIVLADKTIQNAHMAELSSIIEDFTNPAQGKRLNIQLYESNKTGPAALAYEIRQIFLNYANRDDIAIMLDSDDRFYSPSVVSRIVTKMNKTQSNICLTRFEIFGKENLNYSKNHHNDLVKELSDIVDAKTGFRQERRKSISPQELQDNDHCLHRISTIGWTKCYKKDILNTYQERLKKYYDDRVFDEYQKYEDFPDIVTLLDKKSQICAVAKNSVLFRKSSGSVTTSITKENYSKHISYFLSLAKKLVDDDENAKKDGQQETLISCARQVVEKELIPYKFVQYLQIVFKKTNDEIDGLHNDSYDEKLNYSCSEFYNDLMTCLYAVKEGDGQIVKWDKKGVEGFNKSVEDIIKCDSNIFGEYVEMLYKEKKLSFGDVCERFGINNNNI